jgi:endonuclease/exonuclease/phosphatase family metal-dependent hydrolase
MFEMKKLLSVIFIVFNLQVMGQEFTVATFNIRYANPKDSGNLWVDRKQRVTDLIRFRGFDIVGVQEALRMQLDDMAQLMPEFGWYGIGRDDGKSAGEHSAIFYRTDRYTVLDKGSFWLSPTPDRPGPGWDANLNRICSWLKLSDKQGGKTFYVFNAHYDHQGVQARVESSKLVVEKIKAIAGNNPALFMGDLNGGWDSDWYVRLHQSGFVRDSRHTAKLVYQPNGSFNGFRVDDVRKDVIDHIFITPQFKPGRWAVLTDTYNGKFPSDHFPVMVELGF